MIKILTHPEQVAEAIEEEILARKWTDKLPGIVALAKDFNVNRNTIQKALKILEGKQLLASMGQGSRRLILIPDDPVPRTLKVGMLLYEEVDQSKGEWIFETRHHLEEAGHTVIILPETLSGMKMDVRKIASAVAKCDVDAWLIVAASDNVLRWFVEQKTPILSICGSSKGLPIAAISLDFYFVFVQIMDQLISLGHQRIVCLSRENIAAEYERQLARPGPIAKSLIANGLSFSPYNWPCFENDPDKLHHILDQLFREEPPTAFVVDESFLATVVFHHLIQRGLKIPDDVSLFCSEPPTPLGWGETIISHTDWSSKAMVKPTLQWIKNVALRRADFSHSLISIHYVEGHTIGQAPKHLGT